MTHIWLGPSEAHALFSIQINDSVLVIVVMYLILMLLERSGLIKPPLPDEQREARQLKRRAIRVLEIGQKFLAKETLTEEETEFYQRHRDEATSYYINANYVVRHSLPEELK